MTDAPSSPDPATDPTLDTYERTALHWAVTHDRAGNNWSEEYAEFRTCLPAGRIVEIGFGAGFDADRFVRAGYGYVGIDPCHAFGAMANRRLQSQGRNGWRLIFPATALELPRHVTPGSMDGAWAMASLLHVPHAAFDAHVRAIADTLRPGGIFAITLKDGDGEGIVDRSKDGVVDRRFFALHRRKPLAERLARARLETFASMETPTGNTTWIFMLAKKR